MTPATTRPSRTRARLGAVASAVAVAMALAAEEVRAQGGAAALDAIEDVLREARAAVEQQRYQEALDKARSVLAAPGASARWRAQALEIAAVVCLIEGRASEARAPLAELYSLAPAFVLLDPALPPRVTRAFEAEAKLKHARGVELALLPPAEGEIELAAGGATAKVSLSCRAPGAGAFAPLAGTKSGDRHRFSLATPRPYECFAIALDADDLPLGRLGSPADPFEVRPSASSSRAPRAAPAEPLRARASAGALPAEFDASVRAHPEASRPVTSAWWFWTGLGAIAAAGVTVAVVATRSSDPSPPFADITATAKAAVWTW